MEDESDIIWYRCKVVVHYYHFRKIPSIGLIRIIYN